MSASVPAPAVDMPSLVLVAGPESLLAERAVASVVEALRTVDPGTEVVPVPAQGYRSGSLAMDTSLSLFGGAKAVVVEDLDEAGEELQGDLLGYLTDPAPDVTLVVCHRGGVRAKKVLDLMRRSGARELQCPALKTDRDKSDFVQHEFRTAGRRVTPGAVRALVEAVGRDLRELTAACAQLVADTDGVVDEDAVQTYHGGKVEATGFRVADAAMAGESGEALRLLRHAIATGVDPVPIVAVLASSLRTLVKVGSAGRGGRSSDVAKALGMAPWQVDKARRQVGGWHPEALAASIQAVAAADFEVKGGGRDPVFAVERAILTITSARQGR